MFIFRTGFSRICSFVVLSAAGRMEKIACYYGTWSRFSGLRPESIDESLCTSILVSFVQVSPDLRTIVPFDLEDITMV